MRNSFRGTNALALIVASSMGACGTNKSPTLGGNLTAVSQSATIELAKDDGADVGSRLVLIENAIGRWRRAGTLLEHLIHPYVMFGVVPIFGLASAGVAIEGARELLQPLPLGVALGLFIGKQLGVFGAIWLACKTGFAPSVPGTSTAQLYGASLLCGIGFTMSLFIGALAFPADPVLADASKIGVLAGSLASGLLGFLVLRFAKIPIVDTHDAKDANEVFGAEK